MTQEYTPTTEEVRLHYADRWLRKVKADAWAEGHRTAIDDLNNPDCFSGTPNPYMEVQQ